MFAGALFMLYVLLTHLAFVSEHVWLSLVYPLFALSTNYTAQTVHRYLTEERERKRIKDTFKHYVSGEVIEDVLSDPDRLKLGGQEKMLSVMFSDLIGFTTYSELYPPREIIKILSDYYERMTEQVYANRGTLTNYIGDELMAIFGAPIELPSHAMSACGAALDMLAHRHALAEEWSKMGRSPLRARTGINSGLMLVGNVGSKYRFAYTVLGDNVNLASRLEQLNKWYGTEIIVSHSTARLAEPGFLLRRLDHIRVVGRHQPLWIYELVARVDAELPEARRRMLASYAAGMEAYLERRWTEALGLFGECRTIAADDGPSRVMLARCQIYQAHPPPEEWDGTFDHVSKGGG
jgi:adenylate cyclase